MRYDLLVKILFILCLLPGLAAAAPAVRRSAKPAAKSTAKSTTRSAPGGSTVNRRAGRPASPPLVPKARQQTAPKARPQAVPKRQAPVPAPEPLVSDGFLSEEPQPTAKPTAEPEEPIEIKFSRSMNLDLQGQLFTQKVSPHVNDALGLLKGELNTSLRIGKKVLLKFRPTGRLDPGNKSESERYWGEVPEGYGQLRLPWDGGSFTGQLGMNTFTWGATDGFNPVDVVNPRRYHDPVNSEKMGVLSAAGKLDFGSLLLEGIWIPKQRRSVLPASRSRWLPREVSRDTVIENTLFRVANDHTFYFRDHLEHDNALTNNLGARAALKLLGADLGFYVFDGAAPLPAVNLRLTGAVTAFRPGESPDIVIDADPPIGLRPIYYRQTMFGATVVRPVGPVIVKAALAYTEPHSKKTNVPESMTETALEVEHTISGESSSLTLIGMLTYVDTKDPENTTSSNSLGRMFDRGVVLGARWQPVETFTGEAFTVFDVRYGSRLHKLELTKSLSDAWKVYGGGEIYAGKITSPVGVYRANDRVIAGVRLAL